MLRWRIVLGVLFVAALVLLCWLDARAARPGTWLLPLAVAISWLASQELLHLFSARLAPPKAWVVYLGNALVVAAGAVVVLWPESRLGAWGAPLLVLAASFGAALVVEMAGYRAAGGHTERLALTSLALVYVGVLLSFIVQLRFVGPAGAWGLAAIGSLILVVKMGDIGAYTVGRLIGRHKMAPILSPGKTIEGAAGALAFACLAAWLATVWLLPTVCGATPPRVPAGAWLLYGLLVGAAGIVGDLAESLLKRDLGRKDSSEWMPGFGGVLDLLDSLLVAAPVAYFLWVAGVAAG